MSAEPELVVSAVQVAASLDAAENRRLVESRTPPESDLVVFPEAYARDFGEAGSDVSDFAESTQDGLFATEVDRVAKANTSTVVAGMFEVSPDPDRPWNTLIMRGQAEADYRKIHLYDSFGYRESDRLSPGEVAPLVSEVKGFQIGLMTCYDLRFPELARALVAAGAEVLVVPAAWVAGPRKVDHWRTIVRSRAIENTVYVVAVGQAGPRYSGHSLIVDPMGDVLAEALHDGEEIITARLSKSGLASARSVNPSLANRRM